LSGQTFIELQLNPVNTDSRLHTRRGELNRLDTKPQKMIQVDGISTILFDIGTSHPSKGPLELKASSIGSHAPLQHITLPPLFQRARVEATHTRQGKLVGGRRIPRDGRHSAHRELPNLES